MQQLFPERWPVACHTDHVGPGSTFVAIKGLHEDGITYIGTAIARGAKTIVVEDVAHIDTATYTAIYKHNVIVQQVPNARKALAQLSAKAAHHPAQKLKIIGITGTKGKTTSAALLFHILQTAGISSALISTVGNRINGTQFAPSLTTPQPDYLHQFLKQCVEQGVTWVVMEVACHAITLHRIDGIQFDAVIMTNIAREHLEFYGTVEIYAAEKIKLLSFRKKNAWGWLNKDDAQLAEISADHLRFFSVHDDGADISAKWRQDSISLALDVTKIGKKFSVHCAALMGEYNAYNILAAIAGAKSVGVAHTNIKKAIQSFPGIAGRLEKYPLPNGATAIIDYAHNPFSYHALFKTLRLHTHQLIVVFGAGGDRDRHRRPQMGAIVAQYADLLFITTDNPRHEDPDKIVEDILFGIAAELQHKVIVEPDRTKAIHRAYARSKKGALIALIGKGPDEYQLIGYQKIPFSEREIITQFASNLK